MKFAAFLAELAALGRSANFRTKADTVTETLLNKNQNKFKSGKLESTQNGVHFSAVQMSEAFWMWSIELSVYEKVDFSRQIFRELFWGSGVFGKKIVEITGSHQ